MSEAVIIDPEFKSLIPPLSPDEREQLRANIQRDGCILEPITRWQGERILLDGHNRLEFSREFGFGYNVRDIELVDRNAAIEWIILHQFGRRNLSDFARAELALKLKPIVAASAEKREKTGKKSDSDPAQNSVQGQRAPQTNDVVAKVANVSRDTIRKTERIKKEGTEKLQAATRSGKISVNAAAKAVDLPAADQDAIADGEKPKATNKAIEFAAASATPKMDGNVWDDWTAKVKVETRAIHVATTNLAKLIGVEKEDRIKNEFAYYLPDNGGTINLIREGLNNIVNNLPAGSKDGPPGFIPYRTARMKKTITQPGSE